MSGTSAPTAPAATTARRGPSRTGRARKGFDRPRWLWVVTGFVFLYLFIPIAVVVVFSFNSARSLAVFDGVSLRWWQQFIGDADLRASLLASIEIASAVMVVGTVLGTMLAFGLKYSHRRLSRPVEVLLLMSLVAPEIATAVAAMLLFTESGVGLSLVTVAIAHVTFSIVFVTLIVRSRLSSLGTDLEEAAMDLGATRLSAFRLVILPQLWPAIAAGALLIFVFSFDDFVTSFFVSGIGVPPLPVRIYGMIKFGVSPVVNAVGTFMMILTLALAGLAVLLLRVGRRRRGE